MTFPFYAGSLEDMPLQSGLLYRSDLVFHLRRLHRKLEEKFAYRAPSWEGRRERRVSSARGREEGEERHDDDDRSDGGEFQQRQKGDRQSTFTVGGEMAGTWPLQLAATRATGKGCILNIP